METETLTRICTWCNKTKSENDFYKSNKVNSKGEKYIYFNPECKECTKTNSTKWRKANPERYKVFYTVRNNRDYFKIKMREAARKQRESGYPKEYYKENKDKFVKYRTDRNANKKHDISDTEWFACLDYFNDSCAYCGISKEEQFELYNSEFHRDHVIHDGSNYIDNCVPSCTACNVRKNDSDFTDWYNETNAVFSKRRLNKIINWMTKKCLDVLNIS